MIEADPELRQAYAMFFDQTEPRLCRVLASQFGPTLGSDAAAEALTYGWDHRERILAMDNPAGYLYRVGSNWAKRSLERTEPTFAIDRLATELPDFEPGLFPALAQLSDHQRLAVLLVDGFEWRPGEVAELVGLSESTVRTHRDRGLKKLKQILGVDL